ncbi:MAG: hypothetical protein ACR2ND_15670 [Solirubrobacteraceae bacterium]
MHETPLDPGRPRAAADAPIDSLLVRSDELARAWIVQLVAAWPLERLAELPLADFAITGPGACRAALRAVVEDAALVRLADAADTLRGLDPELAVRAAEALRRTLWAALLDELRGARGAQLAELADRLGHVCAALAAAGVAGAGPGSGPVPPAPIEAPTQAPRPRRLREAGSALDRAPGVAEPWLEAIGHQIDRRARDGRPVAALLVEVVGRERLAQADLDGDVAAAFARAERVLLECLRPGDELLREQPGRYWILAPDTDVGAAHLLAWGVAAAPLQAEGHRGAPLAFAVGVALCPDDGETARMLADHAEGALLAARSAGVGVVPE